jgi:hypothetical protein
MWRKFHDKNIGDATSHTRLWKLGNCAENAFDGSAAYTNSTANRGPHSYCANRRTGATRHSFDAAADFHDRATDTDHNKGGWGKHAAGSSAVRRSDRNVDVRNTGKSSAHESIDADGSVSDFNGSVHQWFLRSVESRNCSDSNFGQSG